MKTQTPMSSNTLATVVHSAVHPFCIAPAGSLDDLNKIMRRPFSSRIAQHHILSKSSFTTHPDLDVPESCASLPQLLATVSEGPSARIPNVEMVLETVACRPPYTSRPETQDFSRERVIAVSPPSPL